MSTCPSCYELLSDNDHCQYCQIWIVPNSELRETTANCSFCSERSVKPFESLVAILENEHKNDEFWGEKLVHPIVEMIKDPVDEKTLAWVLGTIGAVALFFIPAWNAVGLVVAILFIVAGVWSGLDNAKKLDAAKLHNQYVNGVSSEIKEIHNFLRHKSICFSCGRLQISGLPTLKDFWEQKLSGVNGLVRNTSNRNLVFEDGWVAAREYGFS